MNRIYQNPGLTTILLATLIAGAACHSGSGMGRPSTLPANAPNKPQMWDSMEISQTEEAQFKSLSTLLTGQAGEPVADSVFYSASEFREMVRYFADTLQGIEYVYMHLAVIDPNDSIGVANAALRNKLTYIFEAASDMEAYYFMLPENVDTFIASNCEIGKIHAKACEDYYFSTAVQRLNPSLDSADSVNYPAGVIDPANLSNTKSVKYYLSEFKQLDTEINYQAKYDLDTITGFWHFFAAIPKLASKGTKGAFSKRIVSQLEFTQDIGGQHRLFYLDTTPNFWERNTPTPAFGVTHLYAPSKIQTRLDNGPLCPPSCP